MGALADEVGRGGVEAPELQVLALPRARRRAVEGMRARAGAEPPSC